MFQDKLTGVSERGREKVLSVLKTDVVHSSSMQTFNRTPVKIVATLTNIAKRLEI